MRHVRGEQGSTLIETMLASVIFAATAATIYPMFSGAQKTAKQGDIRKRCYEVVRGKLDEYRFGRASNPEWAVNPLSANARRWAPELNADRLGAMPWMTNLSVSSRSATQVTSTGQAKSTSGFTYAKIRYNRYFNWGVCNGVSQARRFTNPLPGGAGPRLPLGDPRRVLGMRECIGNNFAWQDVATAPGTPDSQLNSTRPSAPGCSLNSPDLLAAGDIPGFKLYVKLELATSFPIHPLNPNDAGITAPANKAAQFSNTCPNFGTWVGPNSPGTYPFYDFDGAGEGIRVTVTGVMDTESANSSLSNFAGIEGSVDTSPFVCSATSTIYPEATAVRYYLSKDGRIYPVQGGGTNGSSNWILPSLYTQNLNFLSMGNLAFAVHPRNLSVYVLGAGTLIRYGDCGGSVLDCNMAAGNNGVSDTGLTGWANVQQFSINPAVRYIGVDFRTGRIYGMMGDRRAVTQISIDCLQSNANCGAGTAYNVTYTGIPSGTFPVFSANGYPGRLSGFFLAPGGDDAFVSDLGSSITLGRTSYSSSIYRATDTQLIWPIAQMPVAATAFSK